MHSEPPLLDGGEWVDKLCAPGGNLLEQPEFSAVTASPTGDNPTVTWNADDERWEVSFKEGYEYKKIYRGN